MGGIETGELFTQSEYDLLTPVQIEEKKVVPLSEQEAFILHKMNRAKRREWMKANKKFKKD